MSDFLQIMFDLGYVLLKWFFFICVAWVTFLAAKEEWTKRKENKLAIPLFVIFLGLFYPIFQTGQDLFQPVVSSGIINCRKEDFKYNATSKQYRITFLKYGRIEDVDVFYTAYYDKNGQHDGRMTWVKYVDYYFSDNWIQTKHVLNDAIGQHTIVLKYRTSLWKYPEAKRHAEQTLVG